MQVHPSFSSIYLILVFVAYVSSLVLERRNDTRVSIMADCKKLDVCSCKLDGSYEVISLRALDSSHGPRFPKIPDTQGSATYSYNPCTSYNEGDTGLDSNCKDVIACKHDDVVGAKPYQAIAKPDQMNSFYDNDNNMYAFEYSAIDPTGAQIKTRILLECDQAAEKPSFKFGFISSSTQYYTAVLNTKCACPGACPYRPASKQVNKSGLSTGSILCIVLFVIIVVYLGAGISINKYVRHKEGKELVPGHEFWADFPFLVKDGVLFTVQKVKQRGKGGQYEAIG